MRHSLRILDSDAHVIEPASVFQRWTQHGQRNPMNLPPTTPMIPCGDVDLLAAAEAATVADLGLVGVMVRPNRLYGRQLGDRAYEPLYEAVERSALVLAVHEGLGVRGPTIGDRFSTFVARHLCSHPMEQMAAMAGLIFGGTLQRHPGMRVAFLESGTGWLPYWLHRMDDHCDWLAETECNELAIRPSQYFRRQCTICSDPDDELATWVMREVGAERVLWASDFPHPDALFPDAADTFIDRTIKAGASTDDLRVSLWDAPVAFYGLSERFT